MQPVAVGLDPGQHVGPVQLRDLAHVELVGHELQVFVRRLAGGDRVGDKVQRRYCLHLRSDGTYRLHHLAGLQDFSVFLSCLNLYRWHRALK